MNSSTYRPDIDGLRAIAVLAVVLYHFKLPYITGGFAGVDVFFVISGYLIVRSIIADMSLNQFSVISFYNRRIRRIIPALFTVLLISLLIGSLLLSPTVFLDLGMSALASALFFSNFLFQSEIDYFDTAAELKPLLHTWSLAIEEQFYLLIPFIAIFSKSLRFFCGVTALVVCSSFAAMLGFTNEQSELFFFPQFRVWELGIGALCAFYEYYSFMLNRAARNNTASYIGLCFVLISVFFLDSKAWPSYMALLPTVGAFMVIIHGKGNQLLRLSALTYIGKRSYSIYLVHYPIIAFSYFYIGTSLLGYQTALVAFVVVVSSLVLYRYIEVPLRYKHDNNKSAYRFVAYTALAFLSLVYLGISTDGYLYRSNRAELQARVATLGREQIPCDVQDIDTCINRSPNAEVVLLGDSNAYHFAVGAAKASPDGEIISLTKGGCLPLAEFTRLEQNREYNKRCLIFNQKVDAALDTKFTSGRTAVVSAAWLIYYYGDDLYQNEPKSKLASLSNAVLGDKNFQPILTSDKFNVFNEYILSLVSFLSERFDKVILVGPFPPQPYAVQLEPSLQFNGYEGVSADVFYKYASPILKIFEQIENESFSNVTLTYPHQRLCDAIEEKRCVGFLEGKHLYSDESHVSAHGQYIAYA